MVVIKRSGNAYEAYVRNKMLEIPTLSNLPMLDYRSVPIALIGQIES